MTGSDPTELYECVEAANKWCIHGKIVAHSLHMQYCMSAPTCACSQRFFLQNRFLTVRSIQARVNKHLDNFNLCNYI